MNLKRIASVLRFEIIKMSHNAKAAHLASSLSCIDIVITLYDKVLKIFPTNPKNPNRIKTARTATATIIIFLDVFLSTLHIVLV